MNNDNLIDSNFSIKIDLRRASGGQRFVNYLIDFAISSAALAGISILLDGYVLNILNSESWLVQHLVGASFAVIYYSLLESILNGKSIGKFLTGTRAVQIDGQPLTANKALIRSLCRIVPFEAFSFLGNDASGWHDKWSDTLVIDEKKSTYHKNMI